MRVVGPSLLAFVLATSAGAQPLPAQGITSPVTPALFRAPDAGQSSHAELPPVDVEAEILRLRSALSREVPGLATDIAEHEADWIRRTQAALTAAGQAIDRPQLLVVVDRSAQVQELCIIAARPDGPWQAVGGVKISTGQAGRFDHYFTPVGVFLHTDAVLDYRAEGTFNENHIRGLGVKGMRVWDFGWQQAVKTWRSDRAQGDIRLLMHATDPDRLERRLGHSASKGCVRIPATMNLFLDRHGVLDADYERAAEQDGRFRALLPAKREPTALAGRALVVVDSSVAP